MNPLYIVELNVSVAPSSTLRPEEVYDRLVQHATQWLSRGIVGLGPDLNVTGRSDLAASHNDFHFTRRVRWTVTKTDRVRALQCTMRQPLQDGHGARFVCEFTIFQDADSTVLRIALGRESVDGLMAPVPVEAVRRPGLLASSIRDSDLRHTYQGQVIDGRYNWINQPHTDTLRQVIATEKRLPLLLVDGGNEQAKTVGLEAAKHLTGLAQVLLVDRRAQLQLADYLSSLNALIPEHGARLVWPILHARHPEFWNITDIRRTLNTIMKVVASVSVTARGTNRLRTRAAEEGQREREAEFINALQEVSRGGEETQERDLLRNRVAELTAENAQWVEEVELLTEKNESISGLQNQLEYWKTEARRAQGVVADATSSPLNSMPELDPNDLSEVARYLEETTDGAIVFTPNAIRSWGKSRYPHVEEMRHALLTLARAAKAWRQAQCSTGMPMKDWLKIEYEVNYAADDEPLVKKKLDKFDYAGALHSREQHLKLDDHVKPNEVGRVYFATDSEESRFIVDHVGLKLYGL